MGQIKIIEELLPWQVMKRANDGEPVAYSDRDINNWSEAKLPVWDWSEFEYAIIDTTQPDIDWDKFDWDFFNQWDSGLFITPNETLDTYTKRSPVGIFATPVLRESPFYYWAGGEQPVPDNVVVEVAYRDDKVDVGRAGAFRWTFAPDGAPYDESLESCLGDIRGFKLTGRVL